MIARIVLTLDRLGVPLKIARADCADISMQLGELAAHLLGEHVAGSEVGEKANGVFAVLEN